MAGTREPQVSAASLSAVDKSVGKVYPDEPGLTDWHARYAANHRSRLAHDLDIVRAVVPRSSRILECGSVPLILTTALKTLDYDVIGCDLAPERYQSAAAANGVRVVKCNIETEPLPFSDNEFDAVLFNELFEHLRINPIFTLSEVVRILRPGGQLLLSTPNLRSIGGLRNLLLRNKSFSCTADVYEQYEKLEKLGHMGHVREYTTREVSDFLSNIGLEKPSLIFRGEYSSRVDRTLIKVFPSLSPFVTYLAAKPV